MAYFEDTGAMIEAPVESVWKYLVSEEHGPAHSKSARNFEVKETVGSPPLISAERFLNGKWSIFVSKSSEFPPFCICNEEVEGDFAGTKFIILYRPQGGQTRVDVYGDIQSKVFGPEEAKRIFLKLLEDAYLDDAAAMSHVRDSRPR
jgi:hypothetical protein